MSHLRKLLLAPFALALLCLAHSAARADTINFDSLATGTTVTTQFQSQGVLFSGTGGNPQILSEVIPGSSLPNQLFRLGGGDIIINFVLPNTLTPTVASNVSFLVTDQESGTGSLFTAQAFGINGNLLQTLTGTSNDEPILSFSVSGINRVVFQQSIEFEAIDNLNFTLGNAPAAVPEPASMLLLGTGLTGLAGIARRRRKQS
jgi:hypothetical protein